MSAPRTDNESLVGVSAPVLVAGVYLADRENRAASIVRELARSERRVVEQKWIALGRASIPEPLAAITAWKAETPTPKFVLLNRLLAGCDLGRYDFVIVCDDDIGLPAGFLDSYLDRVTEYDFALAQPARTHDSYIDHPIVERLDGLVARRTRFVEIGPMFSVRRDAVPLLTPFSEASPMGWGYDFIWPVIIERAGLRMGIVDSTPVAHDLRKSVIHYDEEGAQRAMEALLAVHQHLPRAQAYSIVEAYA